MGIENKVIIITGASAGIGRAAALHFGKHGAKVVVVNNSNVRAGKEVVNEITGMGGEALYVQADVTKKDDVARMVDLTVKQFGRLDCAFNNAGYGDKMFLTADLPEEEWDKTLAVNLKGVWLCMKYEIMQMLKQGGGTIVNMSSAGGVVAIKGSPAYTASKGGVIQLTKTAAVEYARDNIRINAVCPGFISTPMNKRLLENTPELEEKITTELHAVDRLGQPEEVAQAVAWLCSEASSFVTGHSLMVDGGWTAK